MVEGTDSPLTRGSPAGSISKKHYVINRTVHESNNNMESTGVFKNIDHRKISKFQIAYNWFTGKVPGSDYQGLANGLNSGANNGLENSSGPAGLQPCGTAPGSLNGCNSFALTDTTETLNNGSGSGGNNAATAAEFVSSNLPPSRKHSMHSKSQRFRSNNNNNNIANINNDNSKSKTMLKMAKKTFTEKIGIKKNKREGEFEDPYFEISRCNSYDFETGTKDSVSVYFREKHLVPIESIQIGMSRFSFLLETCTPGSVPDPLLIAALLDLVSFNYCHSNFNF